MQGIKQRLAAGALWLGATRATINFIGFASTLLLARLLTPADFGLVAIATTFATVITSITDLSLTSALIQHKDPQDEHFDTAFTLNLVRAGLLAFLIAALAIPISRLYGDSRLCLVLLVLAVTTLVSGLANPKLVVFSRSLVFWQEFVVGFSQRLIGFAVAIAIAILYRSFWALVAGMLATQISATALSYLLFPYLPRLRVIHAHELFSFSLWLSVAQAINALNYKFDQLVIGYFLGSAQLGYYSFGDNLAIMPTREATTPLAQTLFPGFSQLTTNVPRLRHAYQRAQAFLCAIALPAGFGFAMIAKSLILLTIGAKWLPSVIVIQFLACVFALQTLSSTVQPLALAIGKTRELAFRDAIIFIVRLPLIVAGMLLGGMIGVVIARCFSGLFGMLINMAMARNLITLPIRAQLAANLRSLVSVTAMILGVYPINLLVSDSGGTVHLFTKIGVILLIGATIYLGAMYLLWRRAGRPPGPERETIEMVSNALDRLFGRRIYEAPPSRT